MKILHISNFMINIMVGYIGISALKFQTIYKKWS